LKSHCIHHVLLNFHSDSENTLYFYPAFSRKIIDIITGLARAHQLLQVYSNIHMLSLKFFTLNAIKYYLSNILKVFK